MKIEIDERKENGTGEIKKGKKYIAFYLTNEKKKHGKRRLM